MKVCLLTHAYPRFPNDTTAPFVEMTAETLQKNGVDVTVLMPDTPNFARTAVDHGVKLKTYRYFSPRNLQRLGYSNTLVNDCELKKTRLSPCSVHVRIRDISLIAVAPQATL